LRNCNRSCLDICRGSPPESTQRPLTGCPVAVRRCRRRPATCVPGTRPAPRFKSGGAHQTAVRRAPSPAAPRACSTRPHATWARTKNSTPGPHPQSTPTRTRAQHSRTHTHTHTHTHGAWHTAHVAGRAGGRARRVGASGGTDGGITAAVPFSARAIDVRARGTQGEDGRRGSAAAQRARCTTHDAGQAGGWLGGGRALGRCGAVLVCVAGLVQFGQLADLASYTQAQGGRAGRRARRRTAVCDAASPGSNRACWPIQERRWRGGAASAARAVWKERGRGKGRREARPLKSVHFSQIRGRDLPTTDLARFDWSSRNILLIRLCSK